MNERPDLERLLEDPDNEEEFLLQGHMEKLILEDEEVPIEADDALAVIEPEWIELELVPTELEERQEKVLKQRQITDFFRTAK